jgi:hypothetical protein
MEPVWSYAMMQRAGAGLRSWAAFSCSRCAGVTVIELRITNGQQQVGAINGHATVEEIESVPPSGHTRYSVAHLPDDVKSFFDDAQRVMDAGVPDAAAVQLRRTLEAAAAHKGIKKQVLVASIEQLIADGFVTKDFGDVLNHIRKIGNIGAHASDERVSDAELDRAMRFTTQVLRNLFEVPGELDILRSEQASPEDEPSPSE